MQLLSVDEAYYYYYTALSASVGDGFNASVPFNPTGNFGSEVLGYFGIFTVSEQSIDI